MLADYCCFSLIKVHVHYTVGVPQNVNKLEKEWHGIKVRWIDKLYVGG